MAEQEVVATIRLLENKRMRAMEDIANVTGHKGDDLTLPKLIDLMKGRPEEQKRLAVVHDKLKTTLSNMQRINDQNRELLKNSLEMVEFEMNLLQTMKKAPETADYTKNAYSAGLTMGSGTKRFDSKQ